jgi:hypothetical protein
VTEVLSERLSAFRGSLPERERYPREDLLVPEIILAEDPAGALTVYDAPLGWINPNARIALIGVTPGFTQMEIACRAVRRQRTTAERWLLDCPGRSGSGLSTR